jgi:hypothetical protein
MSNRELLIDAAPGAGPFSTIGESYVDFVDTTATITTPDHADLDITGDIDIRAELWLEDWTLGGTYPGIVGKWATAGNQRSWVLWLLSGIPFLSWSTAGTLATALDIYNPGLAYVPFTRGVGAIRATLDVNDGSGNRVGTFYTAPSLDGPWTQLGEASTVAGTTSIFSSSSPVALGVIGADPETLSDADFVTAAPIGRVRRAEVRSGIAGIVRADPDFLDVAAGQASHVDNTGKTWTLGGSAEAIRYDWDLDLSDRGLDAEWTIGRGPGEELEDFPAGDATLVFRNNDRLLDPDHAGGTWYGQLLPRVPVRIRSRDRDTLTITDEFYGFVDSGWEQVPVEPDVWRCSLHLTDLLGALGGYRLPDVFDHAVMSRAPAGYWVLSETNQVEEIADLAGTNDGTVFGEVKFGERPIASGHDDSAFFESEYDAVDEVETLGRIDITAGSRIIDGDSISLSSVIATFSARRPATTDHRILFIQGNGNGASFTGSALQITETGLLQYILLFNGAGTTYQHAESILDRAGHLVVGTGLGMFVDSATPIATTASGGTSTVNAIGIGGAKGVWTERHWDGWIGAVAVIPHRMFASEVEIVLDGYNKLSGQRSDQHITWALDRIGVPDELRDLDEGTVLMGPADTRDRDALDWMREVARTEGGSLYIDHRNGGVIRFTNRYARFLDTRSTAVQAAFTDDISAATGVFYSNDGLDISPNALDGIINQVNVTWRDGTVTIEDADSVARYGPRSRQIETQATTAAQARSAGEWILVHYKDPRSRIQELSALPRVSYDRSDLVHNLRIDDLATVRLHPSGAQTPTYPSGVGDPSTFEVHIDGVSNAVHGLEWSTSFRFAQADQLAPWIWDVSTWGETTVWG